MDHVGVGDDDALGATGRSGREQNVSRVVPGVAVLERRGRIPTDVVQGEVRYEVAGRGPVGAEPAHRKREPERRVGEELIQHMNNRASGQDAAALAGLENLRKSDRWARWIERDENAVRLVNPQYA